ncbi:MAG: hypothetical protein LBV60_12105 [Streptomyces sp.]|nr:hypothetical protein [Streptomyces sp.]
MCGRTRCPTVVADTLVYRDDGHMSETYAQALAPVLEPVLAGHRAGT